MRAQRTAGAEDHYASIEQLQLDLASLNRCIEALEKADADPHDIEVLSAHALAVAERIDEVRWLKPAEALGWLFESVAPQGR